MFKYIVTSDSRASNCLSSGNHCSFFWWKRQEITSLAQQLKSSSALVDADDNWCKNTHRNARHGPHFTRFLFSCGRLWGHAIQRWHEYLHSATVTIVFRHNEQSISSLIICVELTRGLNKQLLRALLQSIWFSFSTVAQLTTVISNN